MEMSRVDKRRTRLKSLGLCTNCGKKPAVKNKNLCADCLDYYKRLGKIKRDKYKSEGKCVSCGCEIDVPGREISKGSFRPYKLCSICRKHALKLREERVKNHGKSTEE